MKNDIIEELKSDPNIFAECPDCGETFPLRKAFMFYIDEPIPNQIKKFIAERKQEFKDRRKTLAEEKRKFRERVERATESINLGKMLEKVAPAIRGFKFNPRDCRPLFEPIDYLVFNGLTRNNGGIDSIFFIDIKTGSAGLNEHQRQIKRAIEYGKVMWDQYKGIL